MIAAIIGSTYLLATKPDYSTVEKIASKYKAGEMIKTRELMDKKLEWLPLLFIVLGVGYQVISIVIPIYSLTNQLK